MYERTNPNIRTIRPLRDGVIADFYAAEMMIRGMIKKIGHRNSFFSPSLRMVVCIPSGSTEVEIRAVRDSSEHAGGRDVYMIFANKIVKHTKSNAIVLAKNKQLCASGVGQTSRVDALRQAIEKAGTFNFDLNGAVMASDAFFPFPDCVEIAYKAGIKAVIQPGGSIKDNLSIDYCNENNIAMVTTGIRHFKH